MSLLRKLFLADSVDPTRTAEVNANRALITALGGVASSVNSSTTPLLAAETFTGAAELNVYPDVMCSCYADVAGTLYFDFSVNGTDWRTFPPAGFAVAAGVHEFHVAVKGPRYFRTRFVNGASGQTTFQLYTYYGTFRQPNAPIGFNIADDADAIITKSVISGIGDTTAKVTDHRALQTTFPREGKTAFAEASVAELSPIIQMDFGIPHIHEHVLEKRENNSGSVTAANAMATVSTGAAANSGAALLTIDRVPYRAGQGVLSRFTGMFTTGVANSNQIIGIGDAGQGFFFGYNGTDFGILHRYGGVTEVRTLTITTASSTAENITITLDGDADATVAVTASANLTTTANEIAAHDYSNLGDGWSAYAVGDTVVFMSWSNGSKAGTYSLSGATTAVGTFAQTLAGVDATEEWTAQTAWNGDDIFDGNGLSGVTLDPTKGNVFQIKFQYLGFGAISFFVEDPDDGEFHMVHNIDYANNHTIPSLDNPSLTLCMSARNAANTSNLSVSSGSMAAFVEGRLDYIGIRHGAEASVTNAGATEVPITTLRSQVVHQGTLNRSKSKLLIISASVEHTKPVSIKLYKNVTLTEASFSAIDSESTLEQDTSATAFSGGNYLFTIQLGRTGNIVLDLESHIHDPILAPGESITFTTIPKSGNNSEASVSAYFVELI
jgi:hypothetical protein